MARGRVKFVQPPRPGQPGILRDDAGTAQSNGDTIDVVPPDLRVPIYTAVTDENGQFEMPAVLPGLYLVAAALPGYKPATALVEVGANATAEINLVLEPLPRPWPPDKPRIATVKGTVSGKADDGTTAPIAGAVVTVALRSAWIPEPPKDDLVPLPIVQARPAQGSDERPAQRVQRFRLRLSIFRTLTDEHGGYQLNVPTGDALVSAWAWGYLRDAKRATLAPGENVIDFVLEHLPVALGRP